MHLIHFAHRSSQLSNTVRCAVAVVAPQNHIAEQELGLAAAAQQDVGWYTANLGKGQN